MNKCGSGYICALFFVFLLIGGLQGQATAAQLSRSELQEINRIAGLINEYRLENGLAALTFSKKLAKSAKMHVEDMRRWEYVSHTDSSGRGLKKRLKKVRYKPCFAAENLARSTINWEKTMSAWNASEGHQANLKSPIPSSMGFASDGRYFALIVAKKCN
jgi:uncharacterized protein YkwD